MAQRQQTVVLRGGLDLVTQPLEIGPGFCIAAQNYEPEARGYRRLGGWEVFDGQPKPSEGTYWLLNFDSGSVVLSEGDVIAGVVSGARGVVLDGGTPASGSWAGGDAAGQVALYNVTGTFSDDEGLEVNSVNVATVDGAAFENSAPDDDQDNTLVRAAIEKRRAAISAVPGAGDVLGIFTYKGDTYAVRNNVGETAAVLHMATSAGWAAQNLGKILDFFSGGTDAIAEGDTITGATSGATAVVERVVLVTDDLWADGAAQGYLVLSGQSGTFQAENLNVGGSPDQATIAGDSDDITLPAGGKYRVVVQNFYGMSNLSRAYGVNGVGYAFEWDGSVWCPIRTGAISEALDKPKFIFIHANHLFLGYDGGGMLFSGTGLPKSFITTDGAGEIGLGEDLTGAVSHTRTASVITGRNKLAYLTGTSKNDFQLQYVSEDSGAVADTLAVVGEPYFLDDLGVRSLSAADTFGDWSVGTVTRLVEPLIRNKRELGVSPVGALRVRGKSQYRLLYEDGTGLILYFGEKKPWAMPIELGLIPSCLHSGEGVDGSELLYVGSSGGFVYQIDAGTSANGGEVEAYIRFPFSHQGTPNQNKRYHAAMVDVIGAGQDTTLFYSSDFGFGDPDMPSGAESKFAVEGGGGFWEAASWDKFYWDARDQSQGRADLFGVGQNVSLVVMSDATYEVPHTLASITINYSPRRRLR